MKNYTGNNQYGGQGQIQYGSYDGPQNTEWMQMTPPVNHQPLVVETPEGVQQIENFNILKEKEKWKTELKNSGRLQAVKDTIKLEDEKSLVKFGEITAKQMASVSDSILKTLRMKDTEEVAKMLTILASLMDQFKVKELVKKQNWLERLFKNPKKFLDDLLKKYKGLGIEVQKIEAELNRYSIEISQANEHLKRLFEANLGYYESLVVHIMAGDEKVAEISQKIEETQSLLNAGDPGAKFELDQLLKQRELLSQRVMDLRVAESVAMQAIPMIGVQRMSNLNLIRNIESAFIVTLPIFKYHLTTAVLQREQEAKALALKAMKKTTEELVVINTENNMRQAVEITEMVTGMAISIEALEKSANTIKDGLIQVREIQQRAHQERIENIKKLEGIKREMVHSVFANMATPGFLPQ